MAEQGKSSTAFPAPHFHFVYSAFPRLNRKDGAQLSTKSPLRKSAVDIAVCGESSAPPRDFAGFAPRLVVDSIVSGTPLCADWRAVRAPASFLDF
jgi:hypothetical protein